ncbi:oxidoreductase [Spirosoma panaciterrae]|uniref:oxidoreductase n=1 Tax=Spirosoma panaciterrae TaxID=496058 RepID=UPI000475876B|nr:oxidoreductase [Spirosoma panaciterrae]
MWTTSNMPDQTGKTVIITGGNTGIGYETALALVKAGAAVTLACRDLEKADKAAEAIRQQTERGSVETAVLDLVSLKSVQQFAEQFNKTNSKLDVLINNAGVMYCPELKTEEGFELQFGVNFIGHFALTGYLYPLLRATLGSRVVTVSSMAYLRGQINFDNLHSEQSYDAAREYSQSKLADILLSRELDRRSKQAGDSVLSVAAQPGANSTELSRHMNQEDFAAAVQRVGALMEPWQGALPSLYAATMPDVQGDDFYSPHEDGGYRGYPVKFAYADNAQDEATAARLWDLAQQTTGIYFPA